MKNWQEDNKVALDNDNVRLDIAEKVTGKAKYSTDQYPDQMLYAAFIRCPYGDAKVASSDVAAAKKVPGVLEVELNKDHGRYHGDRLGYVCAESKAAIDEAIAALKLTFEIDRPKTKLDKEKRPLEEIEAPKGSEEANAAMSDPNNLVHEATYETQVQTHCCLEPHGGTVDFQGEKAVAWGSTQGTFSFRNELAGPLGLKPEQIEFHCEYVGGGFGSKFGAGAEGDLAAKMSKKYRRPCRVMLNRKEEQTDAGNRPGSMQYMKLAVSKDGKLQGGRIHAWSSVGPSGKGGGVANPSRYAFGKVAKSQEDVNLNSGFPRAMRAPGHPQAMFAVEMMMDEIAAKVAMDPIQFRTLNDTNPIRKEMLQVGAELIGWSRRQPDGQWKGPVKTGFGVGVADWHNGGGEANIEVRVYRSGTVEVLSGSQDIGTGYRTMIGDCVLSQLEVNRKWLAVKVGCSNYPHGPASGGSVTSRFTAPKALNAGDQAKRAMLDLVAKEWKTEPAKLRFQNDAITDGAQTIAWEKACKLISGDHVSFTAKDDGAFGKEQGHSEAVQFAEVNVDVETGIVRVKKIVAIQNVGQPVNRNTIENQITGGVIQGLSFALFENRILDRQTGTMVNANMDMYKIAGSMDVPEIVPVIWRPGKDAGVNSLGEPPTVPTAGAIGCAVCNAIGARVRSMPLVPRTILAAIAAASKPQTAQGSAQ